MKKMIKKSLPLAWILSVTASLVATTMIPQSIEEMTEKSTYIITGKVLSIEALEDAETKVIETEVTVLPEDILKGDLPLDYPLIVTVWGGTVGELTMHVPGAPEFTEGERVLLFLTDYQEGKKWVFGLSQGKFSLVETPKGIQAIRDIGDVFFVSPEGREIDVRSTYDFNELIALIKRVVGE